MRNPSRMSVEERMKATIEFVAKVDSIGGDVKVLYAKLCEAFSAEYLDLVDDFLDLMEAIAAYGRNEISGEDFNVVFLASKTKLREIASGMRSGMDKRAEYESKKN